MASEVHKFMLATYQWHPETSVRTGCLGLNTVVKKKNVFLPRELSTKMGGIGH